MSKININRVKKNKYFTPAIFIVSLDKEISLALESTPPAGPDETVYNSQRDYHTNPLNIDQIV